MRDSVERIKDKGNSSMLLKLAERIANHGPLEPGVIPGNSSTGSWAPLTDSKEWKYENVLIVKEEEDMGEANKATEMIMVKDGLCNDEDIDKWNLSKCERLVELIVGNDCLQYLKDLKLSGMKCLEKVEIGTGCLCKSEGGVFEVSGCERLRSVVIGGGCCVKWSSFTLKSCDSIQEVIIGDGCFVSCENTVFESE